MGNGEWTAVTAVAAVLAAGGSFVAAWQTRQASRTQILLSLIREYDSDQMSEDLRVLRKWKEKCGSQLVREFRTGIEAPKVTDEIRRVDSARRHVQSYFRKAFELREGGQINKTLFRQAISVVGVRFFLDVVKPLELALNPDFSRDLFARVEADCDPEYLKEWRGRSVSPTGDGTEEPE